MIEEVAMPQPNLAGVQSESENDRRDQRGRNRAVRGKVLFRTVNEEIGRLAESFGVDGDLELVCECRDRDCLARLSVPRAEFEAVRSVLARFLVAADHVSPTETVVSRGARYAVVEDRRRESDRSVNPWAP
jgi:hypothetical protein